MLENIYQIAISYKAQLRLLNKRNYDTAETWTQSLAKVKQPSIKKYLSSQSFIEPLRFCKNNFINLNSRMLVLHRIQLTYKHKDAK